MKEVKDPYLVLAHLRWRMIGSMAAILVNLAFVWVAWFYGFIFADLQVVENPLHVMWLPAIYFGLLAVVNFPLEWFYGYVFEARAGHYDGSIWQWLVGWLSGSVVIYILQLIGSLLYLWWLSSAPYANIAILFIPVALFLANIFAFYLIPPNLRARADWPKEYLEKVKVEMRRLGEDLPQNVYIYRSDDGSTLNGGVVGLFMWRKIMISDTCLEHLTPRELAVLIEREQGFIDYQLQYKNFWIGFGWLWAVMLAGVFVTVYYAMSGLESWLLMVAMMTTGGFVMSLVFPYLTRRQIYECDVEIIKCGVGLREYKVLLEKLRDFNWEGQSTVGTYDLFCCPFPTVDQRLEWLEELR